MAHHWNDFKDQMSKDDFEKLMRPRTDPDALGATGKFPDGKLDPMDEGEIRISIGTVEGRVVIEFGKPITSIGFTKEEALSLGTSIIDSALKM